ncbi:molecular chaperone DnaJ [Leptospira perolatii]|uniref:Molecular chaperone DnaJ n=1 Tax=Leptospira perolatii TaxID=2023191 RepID=A0A2M9ZMP8_9LEPT|nr:molecular chaperone DnaJ [Leptospira perolatii]PJZ68289.1 molecular chaperone DnaJ [Leptospira perolatii]PJZ73360.1 molecular chaperone DnaJ [Leptospira perolatii]
MEDGDLLSRALDFYGLPKRFNEDLVRSKFRELSRKYHPDSGEYDNDILFKELVHLRDVLLDSLSSTANVKAEKTGQNESDPNWQESNSQKDKEGFGRYKDATQLAASALETYFKSTEGNPVFLDAKENPDLRKLRENLLIAKSELETFLKEYPNSIWKNDAEKTLKRIGVWFR